jgi:hypothetical protein
MVSIYHIPYMLILKIFVEEKLRPVVFYDVFLFIYFFLKFCKLQYTMYMTEWRTAACFITDVCKIKVILSVPDEGYSECTWWRLFWVYLMKVILSVPDEGYSECTWWRFCWEYLMKVIISIRYTQINLHQVHSTKPSPGTLKIIFIRYTQNNLHQVHSK